MVLDSPQSESSYKVESQKGEEAAKSATLDPMVLDSTPQEQYTLEFGNTNDSTPAGICRGSFSSCGASPGSRNNLLPAMQLDDEEEGNKTSQSIPIQTKPATSQQQENVNELVSKAKKAASSLWTILHSQKCQISNCHHRGCSDTKLLLAHVHSCHTTNCSIKGCNEIKKLLGHYDKCTALRDLNENHSCLVCSLMARYAKSMAEKDEVCGLASSSGSSGEEQQGHERRSSMTLMPPPPPRLATQQTPNKSPTLPQTPTSEVVQAAEPMSSKLTALAKVAAEGGDDEQCKLAVSSKRGISLDFEVMFAKLVAFKNEHGHPNVPVKYQQDIQLGGWVSGLRTKKKAYDKAGGDAVTPPLNPFITSKYLTADRVRRLDEIDFAWSMTRPKAKPKSWDERLSDLQEYYQENGHFKVPRNCGLGEWVHTQRTLYGKRDTEFMTKKAPRMESIGYKFDIRDSVAVSWDVRFQQLQKHHATFGTFDVQAPISSDGAGLNPQEMEQIRFAKWVARLHNEYRAFERGTQSKLNAERVERLRSINFEFKGPTIQRSSSATINGRSKAARYAEAKFQYDSMKDSVDQSQSRTTSVLDIYSRSYAGKVPNYHGRFPPAQVAASIRHVLPPPPVQLRNEIEHDILGRSSPGTEEYNTCETQVLNILVTINLLIEERNFVWPSKVNRRACLGIGDDRREHYKCRALAEVIKQVYLSDCMEVMIWINDILRAVYTGEELSYLEEVLSSLDHRKKVTINSVRNFLAGRSLVPVINIINECEVALSRIGEVSSHVNPLVNKSEDTPEQMKRNALAQQLMNQWLADGELPDYIKKAIIRAQLLLIEEKDACRDLVKNCRSAIKNSKAGLTQIDNNQPHHITADTPQGEEIIYKETSTLHVGCHQSSDTPPNIISSYTRSSSDKSEWSTHETMYMEVSMAPTSSQTTTLNVPINQVAITIADLILSEVLVTKEDKEDNLYIFHDFKQRTTLFSNENDGFSGHLLLISSGRAKAAATPRTTRISGYSIVVQMYCDLCKQVGIDPLFSRDTGRVQMQIARDEDKRRIAREITNDIKRKKLEVLEREQLDELTLLLNSTLKNLSYTRMDRFFQDAVDYESTLLLNSTLKDFSWTRINEQLQDDIDLEMYPSESTEERNERRYVEQKKKKEERVRLEQVSAFEQISIGIDNFFSHRSTSRG